MFHLVRATMMSYMRVPEMIIMLIILLVVSCQDKRKSLSLSILYIVAFLLKYCIHSLCQLQSVSDAVYDCVAMVNNSKMFYE
jgi:hypothetical protein